MIKADPENLNLQTGKVTILFKNGEETLFTFKGEQISFDTEKENLMLKIKTKIEDGTADYENFIDISSLSNNTGEAIRYLEEGLKKFPGNSELYYELGKIYLSESDGLAKARDSFSLAFASATKTKEGLEQLNKNGEELINIARFICTTSGTTDSCSEAIDILTLVLTRESDLSATNLYQAYATLYESLMLSNKKEEADRIKSKIEPMLRQCISKNPEDVRAYINLANHLANEGKSDEGIKIMREGLAKNPLSRSMIYSLANTYIVCMAYEKAEELLTRLNSLYPDDAAISLALNNAIYYQGGKENFERSALLLDRLEETLRTKPRFPNRGEDSNSYDYNYLMGTINLERGEYQKAIDFYEKALRLSPNDSSILLNIGTCFMELNNPDKALKYAEKAHKLDPSFSSARHYLQSLLWGYL